MVGLRERREIRLSPEDQDGTPSTAPHLLGIPYICSSQSNKGEIIPANCPRKVTEYLCPGIIAWCVCQAPAVTL